MKKFQKLLFAAFLLSFLAFSAEAQIADPEAYKELLENFFRDNEAAGESDAQALIESLDYYIDHPINLNKATRDDLIELRLLNELQIKNFFQYREKLGSFITIYELQSIPLWQVDDIRRIMPFIELNENLDDKNIRLSRLIFEGKNEVLIRSTLPVVTPDFEKYPGGRNGMTFRFKHNAGNQLKYGITAENDPGESFFKGSNKQGFDFYSAHFFIQNYKKVKALALGDFSARFGQGLLLQSGFATGKSAESINVYRSGKKLSAYSSFGEAFFFRGAGTTLSLRKRWELTAFASIRKRDANLVFPSDTSFIDESEIEFSALQSSGLHRTESEIEDEKAIRERVGGLSLGYAGKKAFVNANFLYFDYNKPLIPSASAYRLFAFSGKSLSAASIDYAYSFKNWFFFGETAVSENGKAALVNGFTLSPDRKVSFSVLHRHFDPGYQSVYANPFSEANGAANERGLYLGMEVKPRSGWQFNAYADLWKFAWLRFDAAAPSFGQDLLGRIQYTRRKYFTVYLLYQTETKQSNTLSIVRPRYLQDNKRSRLRLNSDFKIGSGVTLRSRVEMVYYQIEKGNTAKGYLGYQEVIVKKMGTPVSFSARYAMFDTEDSNTRVFSFESDLFSALSVPSFAGKGSRFYLNMAYRPRKNLIFEGRYGHTFQQSVVSDSGVLGGKNDFKVQIRAKF